MGCKGLTGIRQTVTLWKGSDSSNEQFKVSDVEFYIKYSVLLAFGKCVE